MEHDPASTRWNDTLTWGWRPLREAGPARARLLRAVPAVLPLTPPKTSGHGADRASAGSGAVGWPISRWRCATPRGNRSRLCRLVRRASEVSAGACVDQPRIERSTARPLGLGFSGKVGLHAVAWPERARNWFRPDAGRDARYDYLYTADQLGELAAEGPRRMAELPRKSCSSIQNNHFRGQALANSLEMVQLLEDRLPEAPEELVAAFPDLEPRVTVRRRRLF